MPDPFVDQLAASCRAQVTRSKWVFVPTHALGRTLGERIAREGTNWLNLRFVTPLDIALRMGAPFLVERGIDPSEEGLGPALMMRLLFDLPLERGYFRPLADHPTMAQALWTTVRELRMTGIRAEHLKADAFSSRDKHAELVALLSAYEDFLEQEKRGDMAAVYVEALKHPDWCPIQPQDCWTELPDTHWSPLQRWLIDAMPGERIRARTVEVASVIVPRRLSSQRVDRVAPDVARNLLAFLMRSASTPVAARANQHANINLFHAGGREAEIDEVFRRILAIGAPLDQVEIACASDAHVALIWEKALRHNWPVTLGPGIPAAFTRPGRALIGFCDWIETDFSAGHFRRLLQSGDLATRLLARAEAGWGRATYGLSLGRLHKSYETRAADKDLSDDDRADAHAKAEQTKRVRDWITALVGSVPKPSEDGKVLLADVVSGVLDFLEHSTARGSALDHRAAAGLHDHVSELRALGSFSCGLQESLRFIRERVQSLSIAPERPRPGHLYVCDLSHSGYSGRHHLFVVGLEEGRVFSSSTEDAVLLDAERVRISADLRLSTDRIDEAVYAVLTRLAASFVPGTHAAPAKQRPSVTFSYSSRDTREFRETYASWLMLQAFRLQQGDAALSYQAMKAALGEPRSAVPVDRNTALSTGDWWLRSVFGTGEQGLKVLGQVFTGVARGRAAENRRALAEFTEFDGCVPDAGLALDPCGPETALSVTELEKAAECPFRFFLKRGLGVRPVDERERDRDVWLDPLTRGSELHNLYAALLRRARDENRRLDKEDSGWIRARAQDRLRELNEEMPAATPEILERESKEFLADLELFFETETSESTSVPIGFEVSFGRPLDEDDNEPLARAESVEIDLGKGLTFRIAGRIDRINKVGAASFEVVDYKTGGFWPDKWKGSFDGGRRLQHALYGLAAAELLKTRYKNPKVTAGVYYFSSRKGRQERVAIPAPARGAIAAVLGDLRDLIIKGQFIRTPDESNCRFCDYVAACGGEVNRQAEEKMPDSRLEVNRRLAAYV